MRHLVQFVVKNTSELDYSAPLLWHLRQSDPDIRITVVYLSLDKGTFLRGGTYFSKLFASCGIREMDYSDFPRPAYRAWATLGRHVASRRGNHVPLRSALGMMRSSLARGRVVQAVRQGASAISGRISAAVEVRMARLIDVDGVLPALAPDAVMVSHRRVDLPTAFYEYYEKTRIPVILLPHAPHQIHPVEDFQPFNFRRPTLDMVIGGRIVASPYFPDYVDYWSAFAFDELWRNVPDKRGQFPYMGYPAFATAWRDRERGRREPSSTKTCVVVMRRFLEAQQPRTTGLDPFVMDYTAAFDYLVTVRDAVRELGQSIQLIVKPHPSNNLEQLQSLLHSVGLDAAISVDSFYEIIPKAELCVSMFSTSVLLPIMAGVPSFVVHTPLQDYVHSRWDKVRDLYSGLTGYVGPGESLSAKMRELIATSLDGHLDERIAADIAHVTKFFPGDPLALGAARMEHLFRRVKEISK